MKKFIVSDREYQIIVDTLKKRKIFLEHELRPEKVFPYKYMRNNYQIELEHINNILMQGVCHSVFQQIGICKKGEYYV